MVKVKWGVLGTASIAESCTIPGMQFADNCELYAIAGRSMEKATHFKKSFGFEKAYGNYDELLSDSKVTAVYIPLPNDLHYEWVMKAIKAGKHVLCEKPLAPTAAQAEELFQAAKEHHVILMEAYAYLHSPYIAALKEELNSGVIGKVSYMETAFLTSSYNLNNIRMHKAAYGGATYDLGCYCTSIILWMLEKTPEKVQALTEYTDLNVDIFTTAFLQYEDSLRASFNCGMAFEKDMAYRMDRLYIHGAKGYIKSDTEFNQSGTLSYTVCIDGKSVIKTVASPHNYQLEIEQLGRCLLNGDLPHISADFSINNAKILDSVLRTIGY